jgi:hypothetical protein
VSGLDLDELERHARGCKSHKVLGGSWTYLGEHMSATGLHAADTMLQLIAAARELELLKSALDFLGDQPGVSLVTPTHSADIDAENCVEAAAELGWKPEKDTE